MSEIYYLPGIFKDGYKVDEKSTYIITRSSDKNENTFLQRKVYDSNWIWSYCPLYKGKVTLYPNSLNETETISIRLQLLLGKIDTSKNLIFIQEVEPYYQTFTYKANNYNLWISIKAYPIPSEDAEEINLSEEDLKLLASRKVSSRNNTYPKRNVTKRFENPIEEYLPISLAELAMEYQYPEFLYKNMAKFSLIDDEAYEKESLQIAEEDEFDSDKKNTDINLWMLRYPEHLREYFLNNDVDEDKVLFDAMELSFQDEDELYLEGINMLLSIFQHKHIDYFYALLDRHHEYEGYSMYVLELLLEANTPYKGDSPYGSYSLATYWGWHDTPDDWLDEKKEVVNMLMENFPLNNRDKSYILQSVREEYFKIYELNDTDCEEVMNYYLDLAVTINVDILKKFRDRFPYMDLKKLYRPKPFDPESSVDELDDFKNYMIENAPPKIEDLINILPSFFRESMKDMIGKQEIIDVVLIKILESNDINEISNLLGLLDELVSDPEQSRLSGIPILQILVEKDLLPNKNFSSFELTLDVIIYMLEKYYSDRYLFVRDLKKYKQLDTLLAVTKRIDKGNDRENLADLIKHTISDKDHLTAVVKHFAKHFNLKIPKQGEERLFLSKEIGY